MGSNYAHHENVGKKMTDGEYKDLLNSVTMVADYDEMAAEWRAYQSVVEQTLKADIKNFPDRETET